MSDNFKATGKCICGAVTVDAENLNRDVGACHCNVCRRWGGGPMMSSDCGHAVSFGGEGHISVYSSSDWAERGFCRQCGTHLFYRLKDGSRYFIPVGLFDKEQDCVFEHQIFIDEKPEYYAFSNETNNMTGAEVFALYGAPTD